MARWALMEQQTLLMDNILTRYKANKLPVNLWNKQDRLFEIPPINIEAPF